MMVCDCKFLRHTISNPVRLDPTIRYIQMAVTVILASNERLVVWAPEHCNISGNELAGETLNLSFITPHSQHMRATWGDRKNIFVHEFQHHRLKEVYTRPHIIANWNICPRPTGLISYVIAAVPIRHIDADSTYTGKADDSYFGYVRKRWIHLITFGCCVHPSCRMDTTSGLVPVSMNSSFTQTQCWCYCRSNSGISGELQQLRQHSCNG